MILKYYNNYRLEYMKYKNERIKEMKDTINILNNMEDKINILDNMKDKRINCYSIMLRMEVKEYLQLVEEAYKNNGGIEGQRVPLTKKSAIKIRNSMKKDIEQGTVLPPLVIGCTVEDYEKFDQIMRRNNDIEVRKEIAQRLQDSSISIIDGMQRTTALKEVYDVKQEFSFPLRIELWVTNSANNLIYRMLVLNTGQISWGLKKQLEVIFDHVKKELVKEIPDLELLESNARERSTKPKKYQVSHMVELYLNFCTRKCELNLGEHVSEEFAKQDVVEKSYNKEHLNYFIRVVKYLIILDEIFSGERIEKRLFGDQNVRTGFIVSIATEIFGRPGGKERTDEEINRRFNKIQKELEEFCTLLSEKDKSELNEFLQVETLKERVAIIDKREISSYYKKAFGVLIEEKFSLEHISDMNICWECD